MRFNIYKKIGCICLSMVLFCNTMSISTSDAAVENVVNETPITTNAYGVFEQLDHTLLTAANLGKKSESSVKDSVKNSDDSEKKSENTAKDSEKKSENSDEKSSVTAKNSDEINAYNFKILKIASLATASSVTVPTTGTVVSSLLPTPSNFGYELYSRKSVYLTFDRISEVTGYRIYIGDGLGHLSLLKQIRKNTKNKVKINKLQYNNSYTFFIASYVDNNGQIMESAKTSISVTLKAKLKRSGKYKFYYDTLGNPVSEPMNFLGKKNKYKLLVNTKTCVFTIFAADKKGKYKVPLRTYLCSPSAYTSSGTWNLGEKYRYRTLFYNSYSQWTAVIHGNILFHTCPYKSLGDNKDLDTKEYNKLGTCASHGCVRLQCEAVKWIYDNCDYSTIVQIICTDDEGPFGKPVLKKIKKWHTWDPTDPTASDYCNDKGCKHVDKVYTSTPV